MVYLGSDHAGYELKNRIQEYLKKRGSQPVDIGVFAVEPAADYPDIAHEVAEKVRENSGALGILVCGTGIGMCMAANKVKGIRAANCESVEATKMCRKHNDANILCIGARILDERKALGIVDAFLDTKFEGEERHVRRVRKIER